MIEVGSKSAGKMEEKMEFLGLEFGKVPKSLVISDSLNYAVARNYDERSYKQYRYLSVKDIKILLTGKNRLDSIAEKYSKALPLSVYLDSSREENLEFHTTFLKMLKSFNIEDVEEIDEDQKKLNKKIPFRVKFDKDYLWQIHYSTISDQYFMLAPTEDQDHSCLFYLLKRIAKDKSRTKIFVPVCYSEYSTEYLKKSEIDELEKYMWHFTKDWPLVYDVYNKKDELSIYITGEASIYENAKSHYSIQLSNKEEALMFYKLLKVIYILTTEVSRYYQFKIKINEKGGLDFYLNDTKIDYETTSEFVKSEYLKLSKEEEKRSREKKKLENKLKWVKENTAQLEFEYLQKEREITTFLDCRKTFFGRVKYFFGKKKRVEVSTELEEMPSSELDSEDIQRESKIKEFYTLEELVGRYKELEEEISMINSLRVDIAAGEHKIKNMRT